MATRQPDSAALPCHVGIIMDGNGRWAKKRGLTRNFGHRQGAKAFGNIVRHAGKMGIEYLSVYAFSTENWKRPASEIAGIMSLLRSYLTDVDQYSEDNVRVRILGDKTQLDPDIQERIASLEESSRSNTGLNLNIALNYGGQDELVYALQQIAKKVQQNSLLPENIQKDTVAEHLYSAGIPDVDLVIRTSGEMRISNFMLWQCAYAEYVFTPVLWPDFTPADFDAAVQEFAARTRRMGGV